MNALATKYAWNCRRQVNGVEQITVAVRLFMLAVAYRIPTRSRYETEPTTLAMFREMTDISDRHLRNIRDLLVRLGELQEGGTRAPVRTGGDDDPAWPKHGIYRLPGLAGPLFLVTPWDVDIDHAALARAQKSATSAEFQGPKSALSAAFGGAKSATSAVFRRQNAATSAEQSRQPVPSFGPAAGGVLSSGSVRTPEDVRTSNNHHDDGAQTIAESLAAAHAFIERWCAEWPKRFGGARYVPNLDAELPVVLDLLKHRSADKLWSMAEELWSNPGDAPKTRWIPSTDRSLFVLKKAANTLDQLVSRRPASSRDAQAACLYRHDPPCVSNAACAERERELLANQGRAVEAAV